MSAVENTWESFFRSEDSVSDDFMSGRPTQTQSERNLLAPLDTIGQRPCCGGTERARTWPPVPIVPRGASSYEISVAGSGRQIETWTSPPARIEGGVRGCPSPDPSHHLALASMPNPCSDFAPRFWRPMTVKPSDRSRISKLAGASRQPRLYPFPALSRP